MIVKAEAPTSVMPVSIDGMMASKPMLVTSSLRPISFATYSSRSISKPLSLPVSLSKKTNGA